MEAREKEKAVFDGVEGAALEDEDAGEAEVKAAACAEASIEDAVGVPAVGLFFFRVICFFGGGAGAATSDLGMMRVRRASGVGAGAFMGEIAVVEGEYMTCLLSGE